MVIFHGYVSHNQMVSMIYLVTAMKSLWKTTDGLLDSKKEQDDELVYTILQCSAGVFIA